MTMTGHNSLDVALAKRFTDEILRHDSEIEALKVEHMTRVGSVKDDIKEVFERAKDAGLPKKVFRAHIKAIRAAISFKRQLANATPEEPEDLEAFRALREAAAPGDLFDFAVKQADAAVIGMPGADASLA